MRVVRYAEPMTLLDRRAIVALGKVRGMSDNASRIARSLADQARHGQPITLRQRHAAYAICWRFRRQIPMHLQVKLAIALADAKAAAEELRLEEPAKETIRSFRAADGATPAARANPLDDLFPETVGG